MAIETTLTSYGDGELLAQVFNSIALFFKKDGILISIAFLCSIVAGFLAIIKIFFSSSIEPLFLKFCIPIVFGVTVFWALPTTTIHIEDRLTNKGYSVDGIPLSLGFIAEVFSTIGANLTAQFDKILHGPNDNLYASTGILFGGESYLDFKKYKIKNGDLEHNLKAFARQCVVYDLTMSRYSIDELKKTSDLWAFLKQRSSKNATLVHFKEKGKKGSEDSLISCSNALEKMSDLFQKEKNYYANNDLIKNLPMTLQVLQSIQNGRKDSLNQQIMGEYAGQQLMMNVLSSELAGQKLALARANDQQSNTYLLLGQLGAQSLLYLRIVMQVLVYFLFVFIAPLSLLPGGIQFFVSWLKLVVWIQLWPPLYAIMHSIMYFFTKLAVGYALVDLKGDALGLSFFTNEGLANIQEKVYAFSGSLVILIPTLSFYILHNGLHSFAHSINSAFSSNTQSAIGIASSELTSSNYSFANTNVGQTSFGNSTLMQQNMAPSLSYGYSHINEGGHSITYGRDQIFIDQKKSNLNPSIAVDDTVVQSAQDAYQNSQNAVASTRQSYSESISNHAKSMYDLSEHIGHAQSYSENVSSRQAADIQESARYVMNESSNFGHNYNLSSRDSLNAILGANAACQGSKWGVNFGGSLGSNISRDATRDDALNAALNIANSEEFQHHYQKIRDFSTSDSLALSDDFGNRLIKNFNASLDEMKSTQKSYEAAYSESEQLSKNLSFVESKSFQSRNSLDTDFANWGSEKFNSPSSFLEFLENSTEEAKKELVQEYLIESSNSIQPTLSELSAKSKFEKYATQLPDHSHESNYFEIARSIDTEALSTGLDIDNIKARSNGLYNEEHQQNQVENQISVNKAWLPLHKDQMERSFNDLSDTSIFYRAWQGPNKDTKLSQNFQLNEAPFFYVNQDIE